VRDTIGDEVGENLIVDIHQRVEDYRRSQTLISTLEWLSRGKKERERRTSPKEYITKQPFCQSTRHDLCFTQKELVPSSSFTFQRTECDSDGDGTDEEESESNEIC